MCFSEEVSWATLGIGSVINVALIIALLRIKNPRVIIPIMLIIGWQYALLMQIPDALAWRDLHAEYPGKLAFFLNVTQPFVAVFAVAVMLIKLNVPLVRIVPAVVMAFVYLVLVVKGASKTSFTVEPLEHCTNLDYPWWKKAIPPLFYYLTIICALMAVPSLPMVIVSMILFISTVVISSMLVPKGCNSGSLWCWAVAGAGLVTGVAGMLINHPHKT